MTWSRLTLTVNFNDKYKIGSHQEQAVRYLQSKLRKSLSLRSIKFDRDNLKSKFGSHKSHRGLV